jgi:hypothetical protein
LVGVVDVEIVMGDATEEDLDDEPAVEVAVAALLQTMTDSGAEVPVPLPPAEEVLSEFFVSHSLDGRWRPVVANHPEEGEKEVVA